ncbi:DNA replication and repair protein RecN [Raineyella antarctica]|uniref:DNA repair protein RecN n=1 Tax=Raineyella antarctica TaxID=1577474 RepID=A0A1G6GS55_9ACTN|nr:DNA repair protein RecN [Raineyella antarctica]SDB84751.1 DNA replication and repair protein RecN [Raineyella antarctica]
MISQLRIVDLGVIAEASLDLAPGFTAVTGETGAGKTMIVTGLGLLLGQRADRGLVRRDASGTERTARVEGRFGRLDDDILARVEELGGTLDDPDDDPELVLARSIGAAGRSRAYVGGAQMPVASLSSLSEELITIHGQSGQIRLARPDTQRDMLDRFGGPELATLLADYRATWRQWREAGTELDSLRAMARERAREVDMLRHALDEIAAVDPQAGEDTELADEARRLQAVDDLRLAAGKAALAVNGDDVDFDTSPGAVSLVGVARHALEAIADADSRAAELARRAAELVFQLGDLGGDLASYLSDLEADPGRLEEIAGRRAALSELFRKYGDTAEEVVTWAEASRSRLDELVGTDDRIDSLTVQVDQLRSRLEALAGELGAARTSAARRLEESVGRELAALAMPHARLIVDLAPVEPGPWGAETIEFLFAANPGADPGPLGKVASGGELSRVRLALEVTVGDHPDRTLVFDEVDSGVGGAVAVEIGRRLKRLAATSQVIVVTHLAQVAAFADRHFVVVKSSDGRITTSGVREVAAGDRAGELARMMAGIDTTDSALAHAEELLAVATESGPLA